MSAINSPAVAAPPLPGERPRAATGHTTARVDAANARGNLSDPLVAIVWSDDRNIEHVLACGHSISLGAPLGRWSHAPAKRRRCYKCGNAARAKQAKPSLVEEFNRQWDSLPEIALTDKQVAQLAAMTPADRAVELDVLAQGQHWNWWADYFGKQTSVLSPWHWAAPKVSKHFLENRQRLFAMAEAAFDAARARAAA